MSQEEKRYGAISDDRGGFHFIGWTIEELASSSIYGNYTTELASELIEANQRIKDLESKCSLEGEKALRDSLESAWGSAMKRARQERDLLEIELIEVKEQLFKFLDRQVTAVESVEEDSEHYYFRTEVELKPAEVIQLYQNSQESDWVCDDDHEDILGHKNNLLVCLVKRPDGRFNLGYGYQTVAIVDQITSGKVTKVILKVSPEQYERDIQDAYEAGLMEREGPDELSETHIAAWHRIEDRQHKNAIGDQDLDNDIRTLMHALTVLRDRLAVRSEKLREQESKWKLPNEAEGEGPEPDPNV